MRIDISGNPLLILLSTYSDLYSNLRYSFPKELDKANEANEISPDLTTLFRYDLIYGKIENRNEVNSIIRNYLESKEPFISYAETEVNRRRNETGAFSMKKKLLEIIRTHEQVVLGLNNQSALNLLFADMIKSFKNMPFKTNHRKTALNTLGLMNLAYCVEPSELKSQEIYKKLKSYNRGLKNRNKDLETFQPYFDLLDEKLLNIETEILLLGH